MGRYQDLSQLCRQEGCLEFYNLNRSGQQAENARSIVDTPNTAEKTVLGEAPGIIYDNPGLIRFAEGHGLVNLQSFQ